MNNEIKGIKENLEFCKLITNVPKWQRLLRSPLNSLNAHSANTKFCKLTIKESFFFKPENNTSTIRSLHQLLVKLLMCPPICWVMAQDFPCNSQKLKKIKRTRKKAELPVKGCATPKQRSYDWELDMWGWLQRIDTNQQILDKYLYMVPSGWLGSCSRRWLPGRWLGRCWCWWASTHLGSCDHWGG